MSQGPRDPDDQISPETIRRYPSGPGEMAHDRSSTEERIPGSGEPPTLEDGPSGANDETSSSWYPKRDLLDATMGRGLSNSDPNKYPKNAWSPLTESGSDSSIVVQGEVNLKEGQLVFGKYLVLRMLGEGGMGQVWLVEDVHLKVYRALKMINKGMAIDASARARLRLEAQAMARISHPNFVSVIELRLDLQDIAYFVMEYIQDDSLEKVLNGDPRPLEWIDEVVTQLCEALREAHSLGIIHRDLKPSNLILTTTPSGRKVLKVLDFGIAKILDSPDRPGEFLTREKGFMGTPPYASPEQACGDAVPLSDIYSVGVILYEFLTGHRPFKGSSSSLIMDTMTKLPPPFAEVKPDLVVPPGLEELVRRCLAKNPEDRPQSPAALLEEFEATLPKNRPIPEPTKPDPEPFPFPVIPRRALLIGGTIAVALLAVVIVWKVMAADQSGQKKIAQKEPTANSSKDILTLPELPRPDITWRDRPFYLSNNRVYLPKAYRPDASSGLTPDGYPETLVRKNDDVKFHWIHGGSFEMGARSENDDSDWDRTNFPPLHRDVSGFYLQELEVTNGELHSYEKEFERDLDQSRDDRSWRIHFNTVKENLQSEKEARDHPAREVSWKVAADFAKKRGGWLPTEAQWEFAARSCGKHRVMVWDEKLEEENLSNLESRRLDEVKTYKGGKFNRDRTDQGIMDMAGNVREWCRDRWEKYDTLLNNRSKPTYLPDDPSSEPGETQIIARGGSWNDSMIYRFVVRRGPDVLLKDKPLVDVGFRMVLECPTLEEAARSSANRRD
jgi:eukaryotic-like serine/threonine-protein kinase